ncbi:MAG: DUF4855 domain-containing protein [Bacteroidales bacterium]|nr:DUF4855 domain-containing protein [Bacteroidales bacterium]
MRKFVILLACICATIAHAQWWTNSGKQGSTSSKQKTSTSKQGSTGNQQNNSSGKKYSFKTFSIHDMVLIYQGGTNRLDWTQEQFVPYVSHTFADGRMEWTFDGLLFIEFKDNKGHYLYPKKNTVVADKAGWEWYLGRLFEKGKSLDALDKCIDQLKTRLGTPGSKHKIVLTVPTPQPTAGKWGRIGWKNLNLKNESDQVKAAKWFIDELVTRFNKGNYKNLELVALYWLCEEMFSYPKLVPKVKDYVHSKNLAFVHIPYFYAGNHVVYKPENFDMVYLQPNYFMYPETQQARVNEACLKASTKNFGLEFECDERALAKNKNSQYYRNRMQAYIDGFDRCGVYASASIAYYLGGRYLWDAYVGKNKDDQKMVDQLAQKIVDRRKAFAKPQERTSEDWHF